MTGFLATVLTLFPEAFPGPLGVSLAGKALADGLWHMRCVNLRDHASDKHRTVDDTPCGGGAGMVLRPDVIDRALVAVSADQPVPPHRLIVLSPRGRPLDQAMVRELAAGPGAILLCGRYEGIDQRVIDAWPAEEWSVGDYVLSGGEPAALAVLDATIRLLPGVMGNAETTAEESFEDGLLEYPHYTRPTAWTGHDGRERAVPDVLLSGDHGAVRAWRRAQAERLTRERRPDLWARHRDAPSNRTHLNEP